MTEKKKNSNEKVAIIKINQGPTGCILHLVEHKNNPVNMRNKSRAIERFQNWNGLVKFLTFSAFTWCPC